MTVLPESGPTRSFHWRPSLIPVLASASVVRRPRTKLPKPAASMIAAAGPNGRAPSAGMGWRAADGVSTVMTRLLSVNRRGLRDQRAEEAGDRRRRECPDEEDEDDHPQPLVRDEIAAVVEDEEGGRRREHRRDPGDVLLPLHPELVPVARLARGVREQEVLRRALVVGSLQARAGSQ